MKKIGITLILLISFFVQGQEKAITIDASNTKNVFLFFPTTIKKGITGNPKQYTFGYNDKKEENFGILKCKNCTTKTEDSSLHIITKDGKIYSFSIKFNPSMSDSDLNHFFDGSEAVGNTRPKKTPSVTTNERTSDNPEAQNMYASETSGNGEKIIESDYYNESETDKIGKEDIEFCKSLIDQKTFYKKFKRENSDVVLRLSNLVYKGDKSYIILAIENNSTVDYDVNFVQFNKAAKKASRKANYQSIEIEELYGYNKFERIPAGATKKAVYVFKKLSIDKNKEINVELNEFPGERNITLPIAHTYINNPND